MILITHHSIIFPTGTSRELTQPTLFCLDIELIIFFFCCQRMKETLKPELKVLSNSEKSMCFSVIFSTWMNSSGEKNSFLLMRINKLIFVKHCSISRTHTGVRYPVQPWSFLIRPWRKRKTSEHFRRMYSWQVWKKPCWPWTWAKDWLLQCLRRLWSTKQIHTQPTRTKFPMVKIGLKRMKKDRIPTFKNFII